MFHDYVALPQANTCCFRCFSLIFFIRIYEIHEQEKRQRGGRERERGGGSNLGNIDKHVMVIVLTTPTAPTPTLRLLQLVLGSEATQVVHKVRLQRHVRGLGSLAGAPKSARVIPRFQHFFHTFKGDGWGFIQTQACKYARDFLLAFAHILDNARTKAMILQNLANLPKKTLKGRYVIPW